MKMKNLFIFSLVVLAVTGMVIQAYAGNPEKIGTAGGQELLLPVGARGTSLGGSSLAAMTGVEALFWNPAGIANTSQSVEAMFSHMSYIADIGVSNLAVATKLGFGSLAFAFQSVSFGEIAQTSEAAPEGTGIMFSPTYFTLTGAYSRTMTDRIYAGVALKLVTEKIMGMSATGYALDMGVQYQFKPGVRLGVAMRNYGFGLKFTGSNTERLVALPGTEPQTPQHRLNFPTQTDEFPSSLEMGLSYELKPMEQTTVTVMGNFVNNNFGNDEVLGGAEVVLHDMLTLRGGYSYGTNQTDYLGESDYIFGPTFGAGFKYKVTGNTNIVLDYAYRSTAFFNDNNIFTLKLQF